MDHKISKKELKGHDAFVTAVDHFWARIAKHRMIVLAILGVLVLGGAGSSILSYFESRKEELAQKDLFLAEHEFSKKQQAFEQAQTEIRKQENLKKSPAKKADKKLAQEAESALAKARKEAKTGDLNKDFGDVLPALEKVVTQHSGTKASTIAALAATKVYLDYNQPQKALAILSPIEGKIQKGDVLEGAFLSSLGVSYERAGQCDKAVPVWEKITSSAKLDLFHADAFLKLGLCYEKLGNTAKATESLEKAASKSPESNTAKVSKRLLRLMKVKTT